MRQTFRTMQAVAGAALALLLVVGASPVAADSTTGTTGSYTITDSTRSAGATCSYTPNYPTHYLVSFGVPAPQVKWPVSSTSAGGTVGWWAVVQHAAHAGWVTVKTGAHRTATATKLTAAPFTRQVVKYAAPNDDTYRVVVHIAWYGGDNKVLGTATHTVVHYHGAYPGWSKNTIGGCVGSVTILA